MSKMWQNTHYPHGWALYGYPHGWALYGYPHGWVVMSSQPIVPQCINSHFVYFQKIDIFSISEFCHFMDFQIFDILYFHKVGVSGLGPNIHNFQIFDIL